MEFIRALLEPGTYPEAERPARVTLAETHISWLFFTGRFVYKVKKPVNFGFLDFTTLDQRRFYCLEEVRLNQRLSPDVYLGVVAIRQEGEGEGERFTIGETGRIVECAVKMRQLPGDRWLSGLLKRAEASAPLMQRIARRIAAFHADAERGAHATELGGVATVRFNTQENFAQTKDQVGVTLTAEAHDRVRAYTEAFLEARAHLFARRERDERIRDCHGDLHADQICVENGIAFIDCIEFNERFRYGDVAADIAFPAMDIEYYGRQDLSATLVREYIAASGDGGVLDVLDLYKCYRAFTRGKVRGFRLRQPGLSDVDRSTIIEQAARYFGLANQYARLPGPLLVVISGLMGTGKTSLAAALAPRLGASVLSSDVVRKELAGVPPEERRPEPWGEGIYGEASTQRTYDSLCRLAGERLRTGQVVILDASFRRASWRAQAREAARAAGAPFLLLETVCPEPLVRERLTSRAQGASDGRLELLERQRAEFEPSVEIADRERLEIDTSGAPGEVAMAALSAVYQRRLAIS